MNAPQDQAGSSESAAGTQPVDAAGGRAEDPAEDEVVDGELVDDDASDPGVGVDDVEDAGTDEAAPRDPAAEPCQDDAAQAPAEGDHPADQPATGADSAVGEPAPVPAGTAVTSTPLPDLVPPAPSIPFDYTDAGVPTMDYVRDKIEGRYGTALGSTELAEATGAAEQQRNAVAERERLAKEKLAELRRQVDGDSAGGSPAS
jgi:hypothetical protein